MLTPGFARTALATALAIAMSGCSLAPTYKIPTVEVPASWHEGNTAWHRAAPADNQQRGAWWNSFGDATLDKLERQLERGNLTLAIAASRYDQALAFQEQVHSSTLPGVGIAGSADNSRQSDNRPLRGNGQPNEYDANDLHLSAGYELDFWGKVRNEVAQASAEAQASGADLATARLSLQARLADLYFQLRDDDVEADILAQTLKGYGQALTTTRNRVHEGIDSGLAEARARTQLADARAQADENDAQRALAEHAIAVLVGQPASSFRIPAEASTPTLPPVPSSVPSSILQRRPDIAAAERRTFAANAGIGVTRAAFFPDFSLTAVAGFQNTDTNPFFAYGNRLWAVGPALSLSLFDGGLRRARERAARDEFDQASSQYKLTVLRAFQEVEDNLALLDHLGREAANEQEAVAAAAESQRIAKNRYDEGVVNYLEVVTAESAFLQAKRNAAKIDTRRLQASVNLVRALGGGWDASELAKR